MKGIQFDNAAQRKSYVGYVYEAGTKIIKQKVLDELDSTYSDLHLNGKIHIHDLEAYGQTYNCLQMDILKAFPFNKFENYSAFRKISEIFNYYKDVIVKLGNEQSGGIGFPNFDEEISLIFDQLDISPVDENLDVLKDSIESFIDWTNNARERCGQVTYYVTLNLGLSTTMIGRFVTRFVIEYFKGTSLDIIKPNIIFKVKKGINYLPEDPNYDLFCLSVESTCKKMIPTYLLFDSASNSNYDPRKVAIMGCRTKVVANIFGENESIGRSNIAYISVNLPRIALEINDEVPNKNIEDKIDIFKSKWCITADLVKDLLIERYNKLTKLDIDDFPSNRRFNLWLKDFSDDYSLNEIFLDGTLAIGFIGLSEVIEILTGEKYYSSEENREIALDIVSYMRNVVDSYKSDLNMNFTLLASSGEFISGRFPSIDKQYYSHEVLEKGFYTNSFHVDVNSKMNPIEKIQFEGPFHVYANGGCISYVEFSSAPLNNMEAVAEIIDVGISSGVNYLGINFPLDTCLNCGEIGTFDDCPTCFSTDIKRIRRVSGYLEVLDFFTQGKKAEVSKRNANANSVASSSSLSGEFMHIAIEGMDGVGKTTIANRLSQILGFKLVEKPLHYLFDDEDEVDNYIKFRDYINLQVENDSLRAWFYGLGNLFLYHKFKDENIITDRHLLSNYYWCGGKNSECIFQCIVDLIGKPDLTFLLHTSAEEGYRRIKKRDFNDSDISKIELYAEAKVKMEYFLNKYEMSHFVIDTTGLGVEKIIEIMLERLQPLLNESP